MGEVTLTDVKYLSPVGVGDPLSLAFWADYVDPDYLREFTPIFTGIAVFCFVWYFIMPSVHRMLEKKVQDAYSDRAKLTVAELGLVGPLIGVIGVIIAFVFAITANSRICMLCASHPDNVRGFGGGFCAYTDELKDSLKLDNTTNCIFVKESLLGPGRRTWMQMSNRSQLLVTSEQLERKFTGSKGVHKLSIFANNRSDSEVVTLLEIEQNSTEPLAPFNETLDAIGVFAESEDEPKDFAGSLGWGHGKLFLRASRETVQLIVFRQDEMVCAFFGAIGIAILISIPLMETCDFNAYEGSVNRERYFLAPMSWMVPTNTGLAQLYRLKYAFMEIKKGASTGWLSLKVKASSSGTTTMDLQLRELTSSDGEAEMLRVQKYLFSVGVEVDLTEEEKDACIEDDIRPPPLRVEQEEQDDKKTRRDRRKNK